MVANYPDAMRFTYTGLLGMDVQFMPTGGRAEKSGTLPGWLISVPEHCKRIEQRCW